MKNRNRGALRDLSTEYFYKKDAAKRQHPFGNIEVRPLNNLYGVRVRCQLAAWLHRKIMRILQFFWHLKKRLRLMGKLSTLMAAKRCSGWTEIHTSKVLWIVKR